MQLPVPPHKIPVRQSSNYQVNSPLEDWSINGCNKLTPEIFSNFPSHTLRLAASAKTHWQPDSVNDFSATKHPLRIERHTPKTISRS